AGARRLRDRAPEIGEPRLELRRIAAHDGAVLVRAIEPALERAPARAAAAARLDVRAAPARVGDDAQAREGAVLDDLGAAGREIVEPKLVVRAVDARHHGAARRDAHRARPAAGARGSGEAEDRAKDRLAARHEIGNGEEAAPRLPELRVAEGE